ncbi:hypothetical protein [Hyphococcus lacteus]|uniref:Cytochrome C oxidase assembly protein n=1 Tax=Hyphococcus lacteus TaxID=3143536 RepID=A0ABV3Z2L1_9PROT
MSDDNVEPHAPRALTPEEKKQRNRRNLAVALALGAFILTVFLVTIMRIGGAVADRPF